jgi:glyoxylase-like metal-dependent hydrolase (beta-lactamase superfamily II)
MHARAFLVVSVALAASVSLAACAGMRDLYGRLYAWQAGFSPSDPARATPPAPIEAVCARVTYNYLVPVAGGVVLVDAGYEESGETLKRAIGARTLVAVLLTHGHLDHRAAAHQFGDTPVYVGRADIPLLQGTLDVHAIVPASGRAIAGVPPMPAHVVPVDDGLRLVLGGKTFTAIAMPGHTPGSVAWLVDRTLFTGDAVQCPNGDALYPAPWTVTEDMRAAYASLRRLAGVDFDTLLDGHYGRKDGAKAELWSAIERGKRDLFAHPFFRPVGCRDASR